MFALSEPIKGITCFGIGYAVPEAYRNQGRAKEVISAAIRVQHGFGQKLPVFYVEAIVGADNKSSQRVAEQVISNTPVAVTDKLSGLPAFPSTFGRSNNSPERKVPKSSHPSSPSH